jgi:hypothetical protein
MSNSAVFFVPAARSCARVVALPCLVSPPHLPLPLPTLRRASPSSPRRQRPVRPPDEGRAERRQAHSSLLSVARARRDHRASAARHCPVASGTPLGAPPWRFSAGDPPCRLRQWDTGAASDLSAPGHEAWRTGSRTSGAAVRAAAPDATPRSACRIVSGDAPQERGCECLSQLRYVVNSEVESQSKFFACSAANLLRPGSPAAPSPREPHHRYGVGARDA